MMKVDVCLCRRLMSSLTRLLLYDHVVTSVGCTQLHRRRYSAMTAPAVFTYSDKEFNYDVSWQQFNKQSQLSRLDKELRGRWDDAMSRGYFRYQLKHVQTRIVPGKYQFVLQLNCQRAIDRRPPQNIQSLHTPFDEDKFNFSRVRREEILFELSNRCHGNDDVSGCHGNDVGSGAASDEVVSDGRHVVMINVSPLEYGHVLLVPHIDLRTPQLLTEPSVKLAIELMLLSAHPGWRVGFNSLCALASVNHLHLHAWYLNQPLYTERAAVRHIYGDLYEVVDYPARGFAFQLHGLTVNSMARAVHGVTSFLQSRDVAHNVFLTRGTPFIADGPQTTDHVTAARSTVRAYVWPRTSVRGAKADTSDTVDVFNIAVCELAGHLPTYKESTYDKITEEYINQRIGEQMLSADQWSSLTRDLVNVLRS